MSKYRPAGTAPYLVIKPTPGAVKGLITLFTHVLTTTLREGAEIIHVERECDGPCRKDQDVVVTQQLAIKTPGMIWYGCTECGTQYIIKTDMPDELFDLPPEEQKLIAEAHSGIVYRSKVSERTRKRNQKRREQLVKTANHALKRLANPKLR